MSSKVEKSPLLIGHIVSYYCMHLEIGNIGIQLPVSNAEYLRMCTYSIKQDQVFILHNVYCSMNDR